MKKDIPAERPPIRKEVVIPRVWARRMGSGVSVGIVLVLDGRSCGGLGEWVGDEVREGVRE